MTHRFKRQTGRILSILALASTVMIAAVAQAGPPGLSTNPGRHAIFPAKGQSPDQQRVDENTAYDWASRQTGWDPYQAKAQLDQQVQASAQAASGALGGGLGGAVKGGAGGALMGVAIGAIAGDAGKGAAIGATAGGMGGGLTGGMRSRRAVKAAGGSADAAMATYQQQFAMWDRNFIAAMEGMGYSVR